jgi:hypothetical protein
VNPHDPAPSADGILVAGRGQGRDVEEAKRDIPRVAAAAAPGTTQERRTSSCSGLRTSGYITGTTIAVDVE